MKFIKIKYTSRRSAPRISYNYADKKLKKELEKNPASNKY